MSIPPRKPMSSAPTDGTPILYYYCDDADEGPFIVAYCSFETGWSQVEECDAAFFKMGEPDEFFVKRDGVGEWEPLPAGVEAWARQWF